MDKNTFLKELNKNLKYLNKENKEEELNKYKNLESIEGLDPIAEANKIYQEKGINITINPKTNFFNSISIIIDEMKSKDQKRVSNIVLFFIYLFLILIFLKVPFIYVRDVISNIFGTLFSNDTIYTIWGLTFELLYAITTIIVLIKIINDKANKIEKNV